MNRVKKIHLLYTLILSISILIFASISIYAESDLQNDSKTKVENMTKKLNKKLLLTEKQTAEIKSILQEYFNELISSTGNGTSATNFREEANTKILSLLDDRQKMKFEIIENDWWNLAKD